MVLTKDDLKAIATIVNDIVEKKVESAKRQTAAGFAELHAKLAAMQQTLDRVEQIQLEEVLRNDHQDAAIGRIRKALHTA